MRRQPSAKGGIMCFVRVSSWPSCSDMMSATRSRETFWSEALRCIWSVIELAYQDERRCKQSRRVRREWYQCESLVEFAFNVTAVLRVFVGLVSPFLLLLFGVCCCKRISTAVVGDCTHKRNLCLPVQRTLHQSRL